MKTYLNFIGIDISKEHLDYCLIADGKTVVSFREENTTEGIDKVVSIFQKDHQVKLENTVFCMEHTGVYQTHLVSFLYEKGWDIWLENPTQIKFSMGLLGGTPQRGKTDKIDAKRIGVYAYKNRDEIKLWTPKRSKIILLQELSAVRDRLIATRSSLVVPIKEQKKFWDSKLTAEIIPYSEKIITELDTQINAVEKKIQEEIDNDEQIKSLFERVMSVPGIGKKTAIEIIVLGGIPQTNEFKEFSSAREFACYIGIAPFEYRSGKSVQGKTKVSQKANKKVKTLLTMGCMNFAKLKGKTNIFREYYQRKVTEGKNKMAVINALRNKLIHTIFALVKKGEKFVNSLNNLQNNLVLP
jgi:transposase